MSKLTLEQKNKAKQLLKEKRQELVRERLDELAPNAIENIAELADGAVKENVRLGANVDILDRAGYAPVQKVAVAQVPVVTGVEFVLLPKRKK